MLCPRTVQTLRAAINPQGQRSRLNTLTFTVLIEPSNTDYHVKLSENLASGFQLIASAVIEIYEHSS